MSLDSPQRRRTQFSSCDACRRARVACDASKLGHQPGKRWRGSCSRCATRKQSCTFEWIDSQKRSHTNRRQGVRSYRTTTSREPSDSRGSHQTTEATDVLLTQWSSQIFHQGFETIFGLSVGRDSCPFINNPDSNVCIPATKLFGSLDAYMDEESNRQSSGSQSEIQRRREERDQISQSLNCVTKSFTARWLPLIPHRSSLVANQDEAVIRETWRAARKTMLKVINRVSYTSVLMLYIFSQTPVPTGISEDEELDGINGLVCLQTALLQVQMLRERQKRCQFRGSQASVWTDALASFAPSPDHTEAYLDLESRAYWAVVTWDTSNSLMANFRSSLTSGLKGACLEPVWLLARTFLVGSFHPRTEEWRKQGFEVSDETASRIFSAASVCKLYLWKTITSLKEALREGVDDESVLFSWRALLDAIDVFKTSIRPLLNTCERQLHFLDQLCRMSWYQVNLEYYLGILVMVDAIDAANRSDLLDQVTQTRQNAEHESFNIIKFGIESTYNIYGPEEGSNTLSESVKATSQQITASFIAIDPYPHHVIDAVVLLNKAYLNKYRQGKLKYETYSYLSSTLLKALEQLPQNSKSVQATRKDLEQSFRKADNGPMANTVGTI